MKRRKLAAVVAVILMLLAGCQKAPVEPEEGKGAKPDAAVAVASVEEEEADKEEPEEMATPAASGRWLMKDVESLVTEKSDAELKLKEYADSFEDRKAEQEGESVFYLANFKNKKETYRLSGSVSLYGFNGVRIGYTKPNVSIVTIGQFDESWYYFQLDRKPRFARVADVEANGTVRKASGSAVEGDASPPAEANPATPVAEAPTARQAPAPAPRAPVEPAPSEPAPVEQAPVEQAPAEQAPVEQAPAQGGNKYTPEEAAAVYKSLVEAGGIAWNPALKGVTSWGTGWIFLEKGQPEWSASACLEAYAFGGGDASNPVTEFYFEVTGSDEDSVYITKWHN